MLNQEVPIKSKKPFLQEWWNIFFKVYSDLAIEEFVSAKSSKGKYHHSELEKLSLSTLLHPNITFDKLFQGDAPSKKINNNNAEMAVELEYDSNGQYENMIKEQLGKLKENENKSGNAISFNNFKWEDLFHNFISSQGNQFVDGSEGLSNLISSFATSNPMNYSTLINNIKIPSAMPYQTDKELEFFSNGLGPSIKKQQFGNLSSPTIPTSISLGKPKISFATSSGNFVAKSDENKLLGKIRKRSIKNNKIVYINPNLTALLANGPITPSDASTKQNTQSASISQNKSISQIKENKPFTEVAKREDSASKLDFSGDDSDKDDKEIRGNRRGSRYRGVSRNGNQWQVLIMVCKKKRYVGSYSNEEEAARAYDKAALQNHGARAKTNFDYVEEELRDILSQPPILKLGYDKFTKH